MTNVPNREESMKIDCQSHVFPRAYAELLARHPESPRADRKDDRFLVRYADMQDFLLDPETYAIRGILRSKDRNGIDLSIISVNIPGPESLLPEFGIEASSICNDYLAETIQAHPSRFAGLATLPWQDTDAALTELDRAVGELGLCGVILYSQIRGREVDADALTPIFSRLEELDVPLVIHPTVPVWGEPVSAHSMITMVGLMVEQSFATLRLILGGVLERHPQLKVLQPHCGGVLPYLWGRIENQTEVMGRGREHISKPVSSYYDRVYLDTVSPSAQAIRYAFEFAGPERIVFGSDQPWVDIGIFVKLIEELDIPDADREKIWSGNAIKLFKLGQGKRTTD